MNGSGIENFGRGAGRTVKKNLMLNRVVLGMKKRANVGMGCEEKKNGKIRKVVIFSICMIVFFGCHHLYQINDLATKGYEIREMENQIAELKKINEKNRIREVELRSMYNIEKEVPNLNLVTSKNIVYLDTNGSIAMK
jgi:hypothetical protein